MARAAEGSAFGALAVPTSAAPLFAAGAACRGVNVTGSVPLADVASRKVSNKQILQRALRDLRPSDVLLAHVGTWPSKNAWAPVVLEPLIGGPKARGMCFATLCEHPSYRSQSSW